MQRLTDTQRKGLSFMPDAIAIFDKACNGDAKAIAYIASLKIKSDKPQDIVVAIANAPKPPPAPKKTKTELWATVYPKNRADLVTVVPYDEKPEGYIACSWISKEQAERVAETLKRDHELKHLNYHNNIEFSLAAAREYKEWRKERQHALS